MVSILQERWYHNIRETWTHFAENPPVQNQNAIPAWAKPLHSWLVVSTTKIHRRLWQQNTWYKVKHQCNTHSCGHHRTNVDTRYTTTKTPGWHPQQLKDYFKLDKPLRRNKKSTSADIKLDLQIRLGYDRWHASERQLHHHMQRNAETGIRAAAQQPYWHHKNEAANTWIYLLDHYECRYWKCYKEMFDIFIFSKCSLKIESFTIRYLANHGNSLVRHSLSKQEVLHLYYRIL